MEDPGVDAWIAQLGSKEWKERGAALKALEGLPLDAAHLVALSEPMLACLTDLRSVLVKLACSSCVSIVNESTSHALLESGFVAKCVLPGLMRGVIVTKRVMADASMKCLLSVARSPNVSPRELVALIHPQVEEQVHPKAREALALALDAAITRPQVDPPLDAALVSELLRTLLNDRGQGARKAATQCVQNVQQKHKSLYDALDADIRSKASSSSSSRSSNAGRSRPSARPSIAELRRRQQIAKQAQGGDPVDVVVTTSPDPGRVASSNNTPCNDVAPGQQDVMDARGSPAPSPPPKALSPTEPSSQPTPVQEADKDAMPFSPSHAPTAVPVVDTTAVVADEEPSVSASVTHTGASVCPFDCISDEVVLLIMRMLPLRDMGNCAITCKRMHRLSRDTPGCRLQSMRGQVWRQEMERLTSKETETPTIASARDQPKSDVIFTLRQSSETVQTHLEMGSWHDVVRDRSLDLQLRSHVESKQWADLVQSMRVCGAGDVCLTYGIMALTDPSIATHHAEAVVSVLLDAQVMQQWLEDARATLQRSKDSMTMATRLMVVRALSADRSPRVSAVKPTPFTNPTPPPPPNEVHHRMRLPAPASVTMAQQAADVHPHVVSDEEEEYEEFDWSLAWWTWWEPNRRTTHMWAQAPVRTLCACIFGVYLGLLYAPSSVASTMGAFALAFVCLCSPLVAELMHHVVRPAGAGPLIVCVTHALVTASLFVVTNSAVGVLVAMRLGVGTALQVSLAAAYLVEYVASLVSLPAWITTPLYVVLVAAKAGAGAVCAIHVMAATMPVCEDVVQLRLVPQQWSGAEVWEIGRILLQRMDQHMGVVAVPRALRLAVVCVACVAGLLALPLWCLATVIMLLLAPSPLPRWENARKRVWRDAWQNAQALPLETLLLPCITAVLGYAVQASLVRSFFAFWA